MNWLSLFAPYASLHVATPDSRVAISPGAPQAQPTEQELASGGTTEAREDWKLRPNELAPIQYVWKVT